MDSSSQLIKSYGIFRKIVYVVLIALVIGTQALKYNGSGWGFIPLLVFMVLFVITDSILLFKKHFDNRGLFKMVKLVEICAYHILMAFMPEAYYVQAALAIYLMHITLEYILYDSSLDHYTIVVHEITALLPAIINVVIALSNRTEGKAFVYILIVFMEVVLVYMMVRWVEMVSGEYERLNTDLNVKIDRIRTMNQRLEEYQNKVVHVNEQINYQKIELNRMMDDLEQLNVESASQIELMKYMASTFDVNKCIHMILDSVMDVKQPKLVAVYVEENIYRNKRATFFCKTNYSAIEARLKKDIADVYNHFSKLYKTAVTFHEDDVKAFNFVGDANINSLAMFPIMDRDRCYGTMIVASDDANFFDKGYYYYEASLISFNVAVNSTKLYMQMEDMARKDGLTGIYNRLYFNELFAQTLEMMKEEKKSICVALFDIDKFKSVNDTYGHLAGDEVIKMVAHVADRFAEENGGFASRYGGEEFLVILPEYEIKTAQPIIEAMHEEIKKTVVHFDGQDINVNVSIGLTEYPTICNDTALLVSRADKAMYYGKKNGRGRLIIDTDEIYKMGLN